jgi:hypothetical protein
MSISPTIQLIDNLLIDHANQYSWFDIIRCSIFVTGPNALRFSHHDLTSDIH